MEFKTFANGRARKVLFLSMEYSLVDHIRDAYIIASIWNGHNIRDDSVFKNRCKEAEEISQGLVDRGLTSLDLIYGFSYGASLAWEIIKEGRISFKRAVLDGGAFSNFGPLTRLSNYWGSL